MSTGREIRHNTETLCSSPVLLAEKRQHNLCRASTDFWALSDKLVKINQEFQHARNCIQAVGQSHCEIMSVVDLRDAYHTLRLAPDSQKYCKIINKFYGSPMYFYLRLGMGLKCFTSNIQHFIDKVCLEITQIRRDTKSSWIMLWFSYKWTNTLKICKIFQSIDQSWIENLTPEMSF